MINGGIDEKTGKTIIVKRVALKDIKFDQNGDFNMVGKEEDPATYEAIKQRYLQFQGEKDNAFTEPLYKPSRKGIGNPIKRVKVQMGTKSFVRNVNHDGGVAENGDLVRIDIFKRDEKYHMVPIYVYDTSYSELPDKIVTSGKGYDKWKRIDNSHEFQFSLHPYDLIRLKNDEEDRFFYVLTLDIDTDRLLFKDINRPSKSNEHRYSIKKIELLEKYEVGILGDLSLVKSEMRRTFQKINKTRDFPITVLR